MRTVNGNRPPHGIVGARCSGASIQLARIAGLEGVPQLSPASNSARLSDDTEFPFFSRLLAPNDERGEVGALVALLREFGWERIAIISTDTQFSKDLVTEFRRLWAGDHDDASGPWTGSVAYSDTLRIDNDGKLSEESLQQVLKSVPVDDPSTNSRIILLVAHSQHAFHVLKEAAVTGFQPDTVWVGPSSWAGRSTDATFNFAWLPTVPGYLGIAPLRNRDAQYQKFLNALQDWQAAEGKEVFPELPPFAAETVDSIVAMTKAISGSVDRRDGAFIVERLRQLSFDGVSGRLEFTANGDRKNPQYSIFNSQEGAVNTDISWTDIGSTGTEIGSVVLGVNDVCFAGAPPVCGMENTPEDTYPEEPLKLPVWVSVIIALLGLLFVAVAIKYWRSHKSKKNIKAELEAFQKSIVGMRAALCDYVPKVSKSGEGDVEEAITDLKGTIKVASQKKILWCWKETGQCMGQHDDAEIYGDPADCWIKYDSDASDQLEVAFQDKKKDIALMNGAYKVNFKDMKQTKVATGFVRDVIRGEEKVKDTDKELDLSKAQKGDRLPADLTGEPQMVLCEGDVIQISSQRPDGWAFGTKASFAWNRKLSVHTFPPFQLTLSFHCTASPR